ncbi:MAG: ferredoxin--NADP reductase [Candidatus Tectomicrobia bacterium]|uniref:Ferredoxin--NADP reductase n=1 Tax=Tectimicrobiota bacterium TaxID=2528274 RepID=A0A932I2R0_UNCTE|nr:ferredoxin--NADP reductase [Candidatus Tectomicrobia bacterium]
MLDEAAVQELRSKHYNATLVDVRKAHDTLWCFRVKPDFPIPPFHPGQYTTLGLGLWEPRHPASVVEENLDEKKIRRLGRRAYSISHPVVNEANNGHFSLAPRDLDYLEFYIVMVAGSKEEPPPVLTPRLFLLGKGDRLYMGEKFTGEYTLEPIENIRGREDGLVVFAGTGTGEGPHNFMIWELLASGFKGRIASIVCVRHKSDLAYEGIYRKLEKKYPNFSYHALTTREADTIHKKVYIQDYVESGQFEAEIGREMDPANTHLFLCGNPSMIGAPKIRGGEKIWPGGKKGIIQIMEARGFQMDVGKNRGNVHFEKYW